MKKYTSLCTLFIRSSIYKILTVLLLMGGIQFFLFYNVLNQIQHPITLDDIRWLSFSYLINESRIIFVFLGGFLLITLILSFIVFERKEKISYTLRRLQIDEKQLFLLQAGYNCTVYLILFAVQLAFIYLFATLYFQAVPEDTYSTQTLFLSFYKNDFLHSLLPLEEFLRTLRNVIGITAISFAAASISYYGRRGKRSYLLLILLFIGIFTFRSSLGSLYGDYIMIAVSLIALAFLYQNLIRKGVAYEN